MTPATQAGNSESYLDGAETLAQTVAVQEDSETKCYMVQTSVFVDVAAKKTSTWLKIYAAAYYYWRSIRSDTCDVHRDAGVHIAGVKHI